MTTREDVSRRRASPRRFVSLSFDDARPSATEKKSERRIGGQKMSFARSSAPELKKPSPHCRPRAVIGRAETADASLHRRDGALEGPHLVLLRLGRRDVVLREQPPDETAQARHDAPPGPVVRPAQTPRGLREYYVLRVALACVPSRRANGSVDAVRLHDSHLHHVTLTAFRNTRVPDP